MLHLTANVQKKVFINEITWQNLGAPSYAGHVMAGAHGLDHIGRGIGVHHLCVPRARQLAAQQAVPAPRVKHPDAARRTVPAAALLKCIGLWLHIITALEC